MKKLSKRTFLIMLLLAVSITSVFLWRDSMLQAQPLAAVAASVPSCRAKPLAHVYEPKRLIVLSACASVSGIVREVKYNPGDGDLNIKVDLDAQYADLLVPSNEGLLVAKIIPPDQPFVYIPGAGEHATFYGALVQNKMRENAVELHPAWQITTAQVISALVSRSTLDVAIDTPDSVPVGDALPIKITVLSVAGGVARPATGVRLFVEIVSSKGNAVRWDTTSTNQLGLANVNLIALEGPGNYTIWVYAVDGRESGVAQTPLKVSRR
jgi:hypothetical protein